VADTAALSPSARVLIVRLGALGDIVHAVPVAAALRRRYPRATIDWLVGSQRREILEFVPVVDRVIPLGAWTAWAGVVRELRRVAYDVAIDLQGLLKSAALARSSGARRVIGFPPGQVRERFAPAFYTETGKPAASAVHVVHQNLALLGRLGIDSPALEFPIRETPSATADEVLERTKGRYVLINPGAAWPNKRWPAGRFGALASAIRRSHGLESVVIWGPGERPLAETVVAGSAGAASVSPPTSIGDLFALARRATLLISGDTGPIHVAAAVGTPIVGIYGPTRPQRNGPWAPTDICVSRDGMCRCHHRRQCRLETMCLMDVQVEEVAQAAHERLGRGVSRV
jgi:heptosyltransferase I